MGANLVQAFDCGIHNVTYRAMKAGCPVCDIEKDLANNKRAVRELTGENRLLKEELRTARQNSDSISAFREAAGLLGEDDRAFFKTILYQWRDEKSISLRPMHEDRQIRDRNRLKEKRITVGFVVVPRVGAAYGYTCSSIGGLALADLFEETTNSGGSSEAMRLLVRGLADLLPGSAR